MFFKHKWNLVAIVVALVVIFFQACSNSPSSNTVKNIANNNCPDVGGSMVVSWKEDATTLDPAIAYDARTWSIVKSLYNGLMSYKPGTTSLEPGLAESYTLSADNKTYTFKLRPGVKFQNGRALSAVDVKYSLERTLNPKTTSPGQTYYTIIKGAQEFIDGKAKSVEGIKVIDSTTVSIELTKPNASLLHLMALNFSYPVPKEVVEQYGQDFGRHPVGIGAYKLDSWQLGSRLVLVRNPDYYISCVPKLDKVTLEFGQEPTVAVLRLERGEVDTLGDDLPPAQYVQFVDNPEYKQLVVRGKALKTNYLSINVQVQPFDNIKVRQAVNMAVNKERAQRIINSRAQMTNQVLPALMPGYDKDYKGYEYNPEKAKALLAEAGFPNGFSTTLYAWTTDPAPRIAQSIQQDLAEVGIKAQLKVQAQSAVISAAGQPQGVPLVWNNWIADFPDPSNFYWPILSCKSLQPGTYNWSWYCNKSLDEMATQADTLVRPEQKKERLAMYQKIFAKVMEEAAWVPVFNEERVSAHSDQVAGADDLWLDPIRNINYDNVDQKPKYRTSGA